MPALVVVSRRQDWPLDIPGVQVVSARDYLLNEEYGASAGTRVFNLCRSYRYQSTGYYVSLLAAARGHRPLPSVSTSQDLKNRPLLRLISEDLEELVQRSLAQLTSDEFVLSIYFGRNTAKRHSRLSTELFNLFPAPLLRAHFVKQRGRWQLRAIHPIGAKEIPESHKGFVIQAAIDYFSRRAIRGPRRAKGRYDLAILVNPAEEDSPSNEKALERFRRAAVSVGFDVEMIGQDDFGRLAEFDALFIRETTQVNHHTYRFARRAAAEGLVVIDDPDSILRCTNKVFLAEVLKRANVPSPLSLIVHKDTIDDAAAKLGFPCILKLPDSSFSQGVVRVEDEAGFREQAARYFESSDLLIAQEYMPTEFDWRVGIIDHQVLYVCKYFMARSHWQIIKRDSRGEFVGDGRVETVAVEDAPRKILRTALRAVKPIGAGLYGVDLKETNGRACVIEVNDNPSIDAGYEDRLLGDALYRRIMEVFLERVERSKEPRRRRG